MNDDLMQFLVYNFIHSIPTGLVLILLLYFMNYVCYLR